MVMLRLNSHMAVCPCGGVEFTVDPENHAYECEDCRKSYFVGVKRGEVNSDGTTDFLVYLIEVAAPERAN